MSLSFALPKVNVFIPCKIRFKIVKGVTGKILYFFLAYFMTENILNSNINTQIIKELFAFAVIHNILIILSMRSFEKSLLRTAFLWYTCPGH